MKFEYTTNCVACPGPDPGLAIQEMVDGARQVTRRTFMRYVNRTSLNDVEGALGYEAHPSRGLTMANDWHVSYSLGAFRGKPCAFFTWSAIEYIFSKEDE